MSLIKEKISLFTKKNPTNIDDDDGDVNFTTKDSFAKTWRAFMRAIPRELRYPVMHYRPFIVMGERSSGKTSLIRSFTDLSWQEDQFPTEHTTDEALQLFVGARELSYEMSGDVLGDRSLDTRAALKKVWKPFLQNRQPMVLMTINAETLADADDKALTKQAHMLRGKLNIVSLLSKSPATARLAITKMDTITGYEEFSAFLKKNHICFTIPVEKNLSVANLRSAIEEYERYLPLALITMTADEYNKIITFFKEAPAKLAALCPFLKALQKKDALSIAPEGDEMHLVSTTMPMSHSNPFAASAVDVRNDKTSDFSLLKHQLLGGMVAICGMVYLSVVYFHEKEHYNDVTRSLAKFEEYHSLRPGGHDIASISDYAHRFSFDPYMLLLPKFFPGADVDVAENFTANVRNNVLLPLYSKSVATDVTPERSLYTLGMLYASKNNAIGGLILENKEHWAHALELSEHLIETFVDLSTEEWDYTIAHDDDIYSDTIAWKDLSSWSPAFDVVAQLSRRDKASPKQLAVLRNNARDLAIAGDSAKEYRYANALYDILSENPSLNITKTYGEAMKAHQWITDNIAAVDDAIDTIFQGYSSDVEDGAIADVSHE